MIYLLDLQKTFLRGVPLDGLLLVVFPLPDDEGSLCGLSVFFSKTVLGHIWSFGEKG